MRCMTFALALLAISCLMACSSSPTDAVPPGESVARVPVQVARAERGDVSRSIRLPASVEAFQRARLHAKVSGYLKEIAVDIGDSVRRDQVLALLDIPEMQGEYQAAEARLAEARAQQAKAEADLALQKVVYERQRGLRERAAVTAQNLDEAEARYRISEAALQLAHARVKSAAAELAKISALMTYVRITAPFDGIITERFVDPGALIRAATNNDDLKPILTIAAIDRVRVFIDIPEREVPYVDKEDTAIFEPNALSDVTFEGRLTRFAGALDPSTGTMRTEIDFANPNGRLYPGMYGMLTLSLETHKDAITVPAAALSTDKNGASYVYVIEAGVARRRPVRSGIDDGIQIEIVDGLSANEQCIVGVSGSIADGTAVRVIESSDETAAS